MIAQTYAPLVEAGLGLLALCMVFALIVLMDLAMSYEWRSLQKKPRRR